MTFNKLQLSFPFKSLNIRGAFRTRPNISGGMFFTDIVNGFQSLTILTNKLHHRCSAWFKVHLWLWLNPEAVVRRCSENFKILICTLKIKAKLLILAWDNVFLIKVFDQLIRTTLLKINSIIDLSRDLPRL